MAGRGIVTGAGRGVAAATGIAALRKLGLDWPALQARHPSLSQVAIVGAPGERAEEPGHDLTYLAESGLVTGPPRAQHTSRSGAA